MNEKIQDRLLIGSAAAVAVSYFLPWMSIMTPFGSTQIKGEFLDYAWVLFVLSILCIVVLFAAKNAEGFGIPSTLVPKLILAEQISPFVILTFLTWTGATFEFRRSAGSIGSLWGVESSQDLRAGLDYGYWLALLSVICLIWMIALRSSKFRLFAATAVGLMAIAILIAFATTMSAKAPSANGPTLATSESSGSSPRSGSDSSAVAPSEPKFDSSPYVSVVSVTGRINPKNTEAERFSDSIDVSLMFKNLTDKTIVGLRGRVEVLDGFGKVAFSFGFRDDDKIEPKTEAGRGAYNFDHNQFEDDDPYSKLYPLIEAGTAKYQVTVTNIAFADGSILPAK